LVLAGGKGTRMGREKGGMLHPDGRTMLRRAVDLLMEAGCEGVVVSLREGQDFSEEIGGVAIVRDAGDGPLGGMIAGMGTADDDWLVVACDLPRMEVPFLVGLLGFSEKFVVYGDGESLEPLCGFYGRGAVGILRTSMEAGEWGLQKILRANGVRVLRLDDAESLGNANTREEWENFKFQSSNFKEEEEEDLNDGWRRATTRRMDLNDAGLEVEGIWISTGHDFRGRHGLGRLENGIEAVDEVECVAGRGLVGDRYFDFKEDFKGQVTFFSAEVLEELREKFGEVDGAVVRRNIMVRGGDLEGLIGRKFMVQGVMFEGSEECSPCYWMNEAVGEGAEDFLKGKCRGGLRARIVLGGKIRNSKLKL